MKGIPSLFQPKKNLQKMKLLEAAEAAGKRLRSEALLAAFVACACFISAGPCSGHVL